MPALNLKDFILYLYSYRILGAGRENTANILAGLGAADAPAADACDTYPGTIPTNDWFLPSMGELTQLYNFDVAVRGGSYPGLTTGLFSSASNDRYWSSCQAYSSTGGWDGALDRRNCAFYQLFYSTGGQGEIAKALPSSYVRPIRAF